MSLINQMLQDLENRRASPARQGGPADEVRTLPALQRRRPWLPLTLGGLLIGLLGLGAWWWLASPATSPSATADSASLAMTAPPPAPRQSSGAAPSETPADPAPVAAPLANEFHPFDDPGLQVARSLGAIAAEPAPPVEKTLQKKPPLPEAPVATTPAAPAPAATPKAPAAPSAHEADSTSAPTAPLEGDGHIEKTLHRASPREQAENEYRRALGLINQGQIEKAAGTLQSALQSNPDHLAARLALATLLIEQHRFAAAQEWLREGLARNPLQPALAMRLARLQLENGAAAEAEQTLAAAAPAARQSAEYRGFHAAVLQQLTVHDQAIEEYRAALQLAPGQGVWWMGLGLSLQASGQPDAAREAYQNARTSGALNPELDAFVAQKLKSLP